MIALAERRNTLPEILLGEVVAKRSNGSAAEVSLTNALRACLSGGIEVVSLLPEWVELRVPSDLSVISPLQELLTQLEAGLQPDVSEAISGAFREMLCNAVEYGGRLNRAAMIEVTLMRLKHAFICRVKDPGNGFEPSSLDHAAMNNPRDNPVRHAFVREEKGLRGGGFGILLASQLVDDMVYNEQHNEVLLIKYVS